jgi:glycosyltransferase involved in cell wall biosynthesis
MCAFDLLAMPSQSEGLSNVILEAMSSGLPVVGFNVGGNKELIDSDAGGYLCELNDWDDFF